MTLIAYEPFCNVDGEYSNVLAKPSHDEDALAQEHMALPCQRWVELINH
jgi:hypothetical protein